MRAWLHDMPLDCMTAALKNELMSPHRMRLVVATLLGFGLVACVRAQDVGGGAQARYHASGADNRQVVAMPELMRQHTLTNMRDHLLALQEIDEALAAGAFDKASAVAEQRLGMSSLEAHGASHLAPFMPKGMQDIGTQMHRAASRFAVEVQNASLGNDVKPAVGALAGVMQQRVACHAAYRLK